MSSSIPFIDLKRAYQIYGSEIEEAVIRVLRSGVYLNGPETEALEREVAEFMGVRYAVGVSSGTEALYLILKALSLPGDSYVLLPAFTFVATCEVVVRAGLKPYFVDIEPETGNISPQALRETICRMKKRGWSVSAVIAVSIFGNPAQLEEIQSLCREENVFLIEDICQALGAELNLKKVGSFGIASATSFYPTKNLAAAGDAGMVFTDDLRLAEKIRALKEHGQTAPYYYQYHGVNGRIDEIQCAILRVKFKHFQRELLLREKLANFYSERLKEFYPEVKLLKTYIGSKPAYSLFSVRVKKRDLLKSYLERQNIPCRIYYPMPLHLQPIYRGLEFKEGALPHTELLCKEILSLPFFPYLGDDEAELVVEKIRAFYGS